MKETFLSVTSVCFDRSSTKHMWCFASTTCHLFTLKSNSRIHYLDCMHLIINPHYVLHKLTCKLEKSHTATSIWILFCLCFDFKVFIPVLIFHGISIQYVWTGLILHMETWVSISISMSLKVAFHSQSLVIGVLRFFTEHSVSVSLNSKWCHALNWKSSDLPINYLGEKKAIISSDQTGLLPGLFNRLPSFYFSIFYSFSFSSLLAPYLKLQPC